MTRRHALLATVGCIAALSVVAGTPTPAGAKDPGPAQVPALSVKVQDACTGTKVKNLQVTAALPGTAALAPTTTVRGGFTFQSLATGTYLLSVSASSTKRRRKAGLTTSATIRPTIKMGIKNLSPNANTASTGSTTIVPAATAA